MDTEPKITNYALLLFFMYNTNTASFDTKDSKFSELKTVFLLDYVKTQV
jgi:hypothetical protein